MEDGSSRPIIEDRSTSRVVKPPARLPAEFRREASSQAAGCLAYLLAAPFVALFLALPLSLLIGWLLHLMGFDQERAGGNAMLALLPIMMIGVAAWGWHDYRRRAFVEVILYPDRAEVGSGKRRFILSYDEVESVRLVGAGDGLTCILEPRSGRALRLPPEVAPYPLVQDVLEITLLPSLRRKLDVRLGGGESLPVRQSVAGAILMMARGSLQVAFAILLVASLRYRRHGRGNLRQGVLLVRQGWLGRRGGFVLDWRGLRPRSGSQSGLIPWAGLELVRNDEIGLEFRAGARTAFSAPPSAENFVVAAGWIASRP